MALAGGPDENMAALVLPVARFPESGTRRRAPRAAATRESLSHVRARRTGTSASSARACARAAAVKDASGLPWGCVLQPLSGQTRFAKAAAAESVARCSQCFGYVHWLVRFNARQQWTCSFCEHTNAAAPTASRYATPAARQAAPELRAAAYESDVAHEGARPYDGPQSGPRTGGKRTRATCFAGGRGGGACANTPDAPAAQAFCADPCRDRTVDGLKTPTQLLYVILLDLEGRRRSSTRGSRSVRARSAIALTPPRTHTPRCACAGPTALDRVPSVPPTNQARPAGRRGKCGHHYGAAAVPPPLCRLSIDASRSAVWHCGGGGWRGEDAAVQRGAALAIVSYSQSSLALHDLGPEGIPRVKVVPTVNESGDLEVPLFDVVSLATAHHVVVRTLGFAPGTRMVGVS